MYYVEIKTTVRRMGKPYFVPNDQACRYRGFRSVYAYSDEVVQQISEAGHTRELRGTPVYSDTLFIDFDGTDATPLLDYLRENGIEAEIYSSGNRSIHVHIPLVPMYGVDVPHAQKRWVKQHAPGADLSFYHPAGCYRLPGTFHFKNPGHSKVLTESWPGRQLEITSTIGVRQEIFMPRQEAESEETLFELMLVKRGPGQRSLHIWIMAKTAAELGLSRDDAMIYIEWWNRRMCDPPQTEQTLLRQLDEAYKHTYYKRRA